MSEVKLTVTDHELDYIMNCLGQKPFLEVTGLIHKLLNQAQNVEPLPSTPPTPQ